MLRKREGLGIRRCGRQEEGRREARSQALRREPLLYEVGLCAVCLLTLFATREY